MKTKIRVWPKPFEVWLVSVYYEDFPMVRKKRPVVVLKTDEAEDSVLVSVAKVTSHAPRVGFLGEVALEDWQKEGLLKPSCVRCSKILQLFLEDFVEGKKFGKLSDRDIVSLQRALLEVGYIES